MDPDPGSQNLADPTDPDPDPKHCTGSKPIAMFLLFKSKASNSKEKIIGMIPYLSHLIPLRKFLDTPFKYLIFADVHCVLIQISLKRDVLILEYISLYKMLNGKLRTISGKGIQYLPQNQIYITYIFAT